MTDQPNTEPQAQEKNARNRTPEHAPYVIADTTAEKSGEEHAGANSDGQNDASNDTQAKETPKAKNTKPSEQALQVENPEATLALANEKEPVSSESADHYYEASTPDKPKQATDKTEDHQPEKSTEKEENPFTEADVTTHAESQEKKEEKNQPENTQQEPTESTVSADQKQSNDDSNQDDKAEGTKKLEQVLDGLLAVKQDPLQLKADIEAALFITGKPLKLTELAEIVEAPAEEVEMIVGELIQDYTFRESAGLEIDDTDGYIIQVREDCARIVHKMMPLELSAATIRTLSAIAIKSPIIQSDLIELRGSTAYDHIAELLSKKLISKKRQGRSYVLNTTRAFDEYFKLKGDKRELEALVNRLKPENRAAGQPSTMEGDVQEVAPKDFEQDLTA